jgi:hypothetical protein
MSRRNRRRSDETALAIVFVQRLIGMLSINIDFGA